ncbi:CAAX prenyl protease-related protein [Candidatus Woesearchaeota archaeon]|nr:CAAX prenyl protease-related protein [Candidatus Woesearchaeota archaeon]
MKRYLIPFLLYALIPPIFNLFTSETISYTIRTAATAVFLIYFYKQYKLKFRPSLLSILVAILIFLLWIILAPIYPLGEYAYVPTGLYSIIIKLMGFIVIAPFIEELFVRDFLIRLRDFLIRLIQGGLKWESVKIGTFSIPSFLITVLFFGFSHTLWIAGLTTGIILNLLLYKTKRIDTCIQAHMAVNFILAIYVLYTGQWMLW